ELPILYRKTTFGDLSSIPPRQPLRAVYPFKGRGLHNVGLRVTARPPAIAGRRGKCLGTGEAAQISVPVASTANLDCLLPVLDVICRFPSRSKARSCPQNRRKSGECRISGRGSRGTGLAS